MKDWLASLGHREQLLVGAAAVLLLLLIVYAAVWQPFYGRYQRLQTAVEAHRQTLVWMMQAAREVKALQATSRRELQGLGGRSLLAVVDQSARQAGLGPVLKRVEPEGSNDVRVWLEGASFDDMVKWLEALGSKNGVDISVITIERQDDPGRVNARVTLQATRS
jgi:general secretion pathway protein M